MNSHDPMFDSSSLSQFYVRGIEPEEDFTIFCPICAEEMIQIQSEEFLPDVRLCVCPLCSMRSAGSRPRGRV